MNMTRLEAIKARLAAATPGPWRHCHNRGFSSGGIYTYSRDCTCHPPNKHGFTTTEGKYCRGGEVVLAVEDEFITGDDANGELIAHAPSDLALLLEVVEAARVEAQIRHDPDNTGASCQDYEAAKDAVEAALAKLEER